MILIRIGQVQLICTNVHPTNHQINDLFLSMLASLPSSVNTSRSFNRFVFLLFGVDWLGVSSGEGTTTWSIHVHNSNIPCKKNLGLVDTALLTGTF